MSYQSLQSEANLKRRQAETAIRESTQAQAQLTTYFLLRDEAQSVLLVSAAELIARYAGTEGVEWLSKYSEIRKPK